MIDVLLRYGGEQALFWAARNGLTEDIGRIIGQNPSLFDATDLAERKAIDLVQRYGR